MSKFNLETNVYVQRDKRIGCLCSRMINAFQIKNLLYFFIWQIQLGKLDLTFNWQLTIQCKAEFHVEKIDLEINNFG